jgi:Holliday junction resolvase RusA-like endonuclease
VVFKPILLITQQKMYSFVLKRQPKSYNGWNKASKMSKDNYKTAIEEAFQKLNQISDPLTDELYGVLYHFFRKDLQIDADNLSKPIWDCLTGFLYLDDSQVKLRIAGSFDLSKNNFSVLDIEALPKSISDELVEAFKNYDHIVYIECDLLNRSMFKFNSEKNAD